MRAERGRGTVAGAGAERPLNRGLGALLAALFPPACVGCGRAGHVLCRACGPSPAGAPHVTYAGLEVRALGEYEGALRRAVLALKAGRRDVAACLGALLAERWGPWLAADAVLVSVPTTEARRLARGFDQAALLARALAERTGLPVAAALGRRSGGVQQGRSREERWRAGERFLCVSGARLGGRRVVLIDDVVTTGATLADCSAVLRDGGATVRAALVVARACIAGPERGVLGSASNEERMPKAVWNGAVLAQSERTVIVEGNHYFPRESVNGAYLRESRTHTVCPWKGTASYYSIVVHDRENKDAAWFYPEPKPAAANVKDRIAFWRGVKVEP